MRRGAIGRSSMLAVVCVIGFAAAHSTDAGDGDTRGSGTATEFAYTTDEIDRGFERALEHAVLQRKVRSKSVVASTMAVPADLDRDAPLLDQDHAALELRTKDIVMQPRPCPAEPVSVRVPIPFAKNSHELEPGAEVQLEAVARFLSRRPSVRLCVNGHTDKLGPDEWNLLLSKLRALRVVVALRDRGIGAERLSAWGHGSNRPLRGVDQSVEKGQSMNRRVEFEVEVGM